MHAIRADQALELFRRALAADAAEKDEGDGGSGRPSPALLAALIVVSKMGATQFKLGHVEAALDTYGAGLALAEDGLHGPHADEAAIGGAVSSLYAACAATHAAKGGDAAANSKAAVGLLRLGAARFPRNGDVHYNLGTVLAAAGMWTEAAVSYRTSCELAPSADAWGDLAAALLETGDDDAAWEARASRRRILKAEQEASDAADTRRGKKGRDKDCWGGHGGARAKLKKKKASATEILNGTVKVEKSHRPVKSLNPQAPRFGMASHGVPNKARNVRNKIGAQTSLLANKKKAARRGAAAGQKW